MLKIERFGLLLGAVCLFIFSHAVVSDDQQPPGSPVPEKSPSSIIKADQLGGEQRYLIYASLDKPIYRERETVYIRATFLSANDNTPVVNGTVSASIKIRGPKGDYVFEGYAVGEDSTAGIKWDIPEGTPGGQYTVLASSPDMGVPQTERGFEIRAYRTPRLKTQIEFIRDGYGPGDDVDATIKIGRAEGDVPVGADVTVIARVDGNEVFNQSGYKLSANGILSTRFSLPPEIEVGDGSLSFIIEDGGVIETASKTLPILLQNMDIAFYPEGGDLVVGLSSRVYLQVRRPDGKPADIRGRIIEVTGREVDGTVDVIKGNSAIAKVVTEHEGRGVFKLTPESGKRYALVLDEPTGIARQFELPEAKPSGTVMTSDAPVFASLENITVDLASTGANPATMVTLYKRERLIDSVSIRGVANAVALEPGDAEGVLIVTAWDANGAPLAERLVYRQPRFAINVELNKSAQSYIPGQEVSLEILTTDENGKPVEAVVGLTVTDDSVLELVDKREQAPRLPVMVYLENEVKDLADAHVYLDAQNKRAPMAVDRLLGTQGWRRFILVNYEEIKQSYSEAALRVLAESKPVPNLLPQPMMLEEVVMMARREDKPRVEAVAELEDNEGAPEKRKEAALDDPGEIEQPPAPVEADAVVQGKLQANRAIVVPNRQVAAAPAMMDDIFREAPMMVTLREYAHQVRPNRKANDRVDFTETLYWHKGVRTGARDGKATIKFGLSDSVTSFRVIGDAFGRNGALGTNDGLIKSIEPFYIEPKMPLEVTVGDVVELPVALINATPENLLAANLIVTAPGLDVIQASATDLPAGARERRSVKVIADRPGEFLMTFSAAAGSYADRVSRALVVRPKGFPISISHGGLLDAEQPFTTEVLIGDSMEPGSLIAVAKVYPSPLANMEEALNALLRQPNGCFEQTSSSNYPLVMAQQYFLSHQGVDPEKISQARKLLDAGYKKLIGFESQGDGYEWFGANPAHEALTAYGLMEFVDMAKVMEVDPAMIKRTRDWLLERRDGQGGFKRNDRALDSFGRAPAPTTDAYILWSLLESGESPSLLSKEIAAVKEQALNTDDSYVIALAANILYLAGDSAAADTLAEKLVQAVNADGAVTNSLTSITQSGGDALMIETTSLSLTAWLKNDERWAAQVETSMKWLFERSKSGRFGSTQSTILALKAINAYDAARAKPKQPGSVQLLVDGKKFGKPIKFNKDSKGAIELPDFSAALTSGEHTLGLAMQDGSKMPFALGLLYNSTQPASAKDVAVSIETKLSSSSVLEGEPLEMSVSVSVGNKAAPTPIAIIGVPAGLEVRHDRLKELVAASRISAYEVNGREVVLYWRALKADEQRTVPIDLIGAVPGTYTAPASRAYLYYTDENKQWVAGQKVAVISRSGAN